MRRAENSQQLGPRPSSTEIERSTTAPQLSITEDTTSSRLLPLWLDAKHAKQIVKGDLTAISDCPQTVDRGEWVAHQVVEQYRNVVNFTRIIQDKDERGTSICDASTCPGMSAGSRSYSLLDENGAIALLPAQTFITLAQEWITRKIDNERLFPTISSGVTSAPHPDFHKDHVGEEDWLGIKSGFPREFEITCRLIFRQIYRIYAHIYWCHFTEPFYHLNLERQLNSCFCSFILTATALSMLHHKELEPMQDLINLWAADGSFPPHSKAFAYADLDRGQYLLNLSAQR